MASVIQFLKKNRVFRFMSSVRLAVPLMLILGGVVAAGTLYESRYNAQVAGLMVYRTWWFQGLMLVLWLNIFCAGLSRIPYKEHHTGFVITHIGLLTLLIGAQITATFGIDGQLRVLEGQSSNTVMLSEPVLKVAHTGAQPMWTFHLARSLRSKTGDQLGVSRLTGETGVVVENYLPFVTMEQTLTGGGSPSGASPGSTEMALTFTLQSQFFNVNDSLQSGNKPEMQMGPAILRIITDTESTATESTATESTATESTATESHVSAEPSSVRVPTLIVKDRTSGKILAHLPVSDLKNGPKTLRGVRITLLKVYEQAAVGKGGVSENGQPGANPALDLRLESGGKNVREISFSKFPNFALNPAGSFGLQFEYVTSGGTSSQAIPMHGLDEHTPPPIGAGRNVIEFHVSPKDTQTLRVVLLKDGAQVLSKKLKVGEILQTPWMGMRITVTSLLPNAVMGESIRPTELQPKMPLPPSAIFVRSDQPGSEGTWLIEGDTKTLQTSHGTYDVYFGQDSVTLPFNVKLDEFRKLDYPGTDTAMSFESTIRLNGGGAPILIQMNEPFNHAGYLLYQSSYEVGPDIPTASIFSVNRDPGRWVKYFGAIILIVGIALFTIMRTRWYLNRRTRKSMKTISIATAILVLAVFSGVPSAHADGSAFQDFTPNVARENFKSFASQIDSSQIETLPMQSHGRVKPFDSFARESVLFLTGKYSLWGLNSVQLYLGLILSDATPYLELINIRDPEFRTTLGFQKSQRYFTLQQLEASHLEEIAKPIMAKAQKNEKLVTPEEEKILEVMQQVWMLRSVLTGAQFNDGVVLDVGPGSPGGHVGSGSLMTQKAQQYLGALKAKDFPGASMAAIELLSAAKSQPMPDLFRPSIEKMGLEVTYNHVRLFFLVAILYLLLGIALVSGMLKKQLTTRVVLSILAIPMLLHIVGFVTRVYITGFAPVTNMYGTMIWVAFGVVFFGAVLFALYKNALVFGLLLAGASATLLLTDSIPLILSPDMDPIVAVLRNNLWLTIHVLTISISYAAFTIAMLIGNTGLVQTILRKDSPDGLKNLAHLAYRAIQLGVFLITTGIILGGWWADYSWGRFWGWDPKETWALIADLGFIAILHARFLGWLSSFGVLAAAPIAYLLVIMAWYGVNFILAAGLHSYGFSSGGATMVVTFVAFQLTLFGAAMLSKKMNHGLSR